MITISNSQLFKPELILKYIKQNGNELKLKKNEFIYHSGDPTEHIYVIETGEVFVLRMQDDGSENAILKRRLFVWSAHFILWTKASFYVC